MAALGNFFKTVDATTGKETLKEACTTGTPGVSQIVSTDPTTGQLDPSLVPGGEICTANAGEALAAGDAVTFNASGEVVKADNSNGRAAIGYVVNAVALGQPAQVFGEGIMTVAGPLTIGDCVFLDTAGGVTQTPLDPTLPASDGDLHQELGMAISSTQIKFERGDAATIEQC